MDKNDDSLDKAISMVAWIFAICFTMYLVITHNTGEIFYYVIFTVIMYGVFLVVVPPIVRWVNDIFKD